MNNNTKTKAEIYDTLYGSVVTEEDEEVVWVHCDTDTCGEYQDYYTLLSFNIA